VPLGFVGACCEDPLSLTLSRVSPTGRFLHAAHRTGRADFLNPALGQVSRDARRRGSARGSNFVHLLTPPAAFSPCEAP
jgi:hypothetical protein